MPNRETHLLLDRLLTKTERPWVHNMLDAYVQQLGPHHRRKTHTQEMVALIFLKSGGDIGALISAEAHILADREFSRSQKILRKLLNSKRR